MRRASHDVVVVGGGPAGSATAARLARAGVDVAVVDRDRFPRAKCCAEYGSPGTVRELELLGALPALLRHHTTRLTGTSVTAPGGSRLDGAFRDAGDGAAPTSGLALPRQLLDAELLALARRAGATVHTATRLRTVSRRPDGRLALSLEADGAAMTIDCRLVVGADGLRSRVARELGLHARGRLRRIAFVTHVEGVAAIGDAAEMHVGRRGYVGLNPIDGHLTNVAHGGDGRSHPDRFAPRRAVRPAPCLTPSSG